jgi:serine/threonine kinase 38
LNIPLEANLSPAAPDLLKKFMTDADNRLGSNGVDEIKRHPFFEGVNWETIRDSKSTYIPDLASEEDCKRFDKFDEDEPFYPVEDKKGKKARRDINFPGYTYKKDIEEQKNNLVKALNESL